MLVMCKVKISHDLYRYLKFTQFEHYWFISRKIRERNVWKNVSRTYGECMEAIYMYNDTFETDKEYHYIECSYAS